MTASQTRVPALLIDAGNSLIKWALAGADPTRFAQQGVFTHAHAHTQRMPSLAVEPDWSDLPTPRSVWISNVAGEQCARRIEQLIRARWPEVPRHTIRARAQQCGVRNGYRDVRQLGSDRWASLIGARAAWPNEAVLIVTIGTAMTLDMLDASGHFAGGLITPGGYLMMHALGAHTALLPTLALSSQDAPTLHTCPDSDAWLATDTHSALSTGCLIAQAALIEHVWQAARQRLKTPVRCLLSGGGVQNIRPLLAIDTTHQEHLVLWGLARIAQEYALSRVRPDTAQECSG